jgi:hypothetical protein
MLEPYDGARLAVETQIEPVLEICSCCHKYVFFNMISLSVQK